MSTPSVSVSESSSRENVFVSPPLAGPSRGRLFATFAEWRRRMRARRELALLSTFDLKDIGYPPQIEAEKVKPFWRA
jgi:uncharacterized protein YjiS (DUF1127 family)